VRELLEALARELVEQPERVSVRERAEPDGLLLTLAVAGPDRGRVIGRHGVTAEALRTLLEAVARKQGLRCELEIAE
jgi:predicted RNA-binding protein YlqC (UPF0109 family)